jgi:SAM-dependent methyltransferase
VTRFELIYSCLRYFFPPLYNKVRSALLALTKIRDGDIEVLDIGGRKSHYTIGVPAHITITDLPRQSELQNILNLGVTPNMADQILALRSNVRRVVFDDMTRSRLSDNSFDCAIAVEVLEHVEEDDLFVSEVHRVLKPGGCFVMSTPNGDYVRNTNPDHKRHYTREQLRRLLASRFSYVELEYAVKGGKYRKLGQHPWSLKHPWQTAKSMLGHLINTIESAPKSLKNQAQGTHHLIAIARKAR